MLHGQQNVKIFRRCLNGS